MPCFGQLWCIQMCRGLQGSSAGRVCQKMCKWRGFLQMLCKVCEHPFLCFWPGFQTVSQHLKYGLGGEGTLNPPPPNPELTLLFQQSLQTHQTQSRWEEGELEEVYTLLGNLLNFLKISFYIYLTKLYVPWSFALASSVTYCTVQCTAKSVKICLTLYSRRDRKMHGTVRMHVKQFRIGIRI